MEKPNPLEALLEEFNPEDLLSNTKELDSIANMIVIGSKDSSQEFEAVKIRISIALVQVLIAIHTDLLIIGDQLGTYLEETELVEIEE